ncbi:protein kinase [Hamiltosporidium tvaerminnensis]|uniref:Protein kinase n=1 Tax=Hamiltosporidium tvaerminnensis TaxID=1176355 RepID=A0A4V2JXJ8_9MICR|nr:protein kinase [Hamiltosporidium tvaerminnensis]
MRFVEFDLTEYQIIHNDLKHNNILIDEYLDIKICDFGISCYKKELAFPFKTLPPTDLEKYIVYSPELKKSEEYDEQSDMYSFGILIYFIFNKKN